MNQGTQLKCKSPSKGLAKGSSSESIPVPDRESESLQISNKCFPLQHLRCGVVSATAKAAMQMTLVHAPSPYPTHKAREEAWSITNGFEGISKRAFARCELVFLEEAC